MLTLKHAVTVISSFVLVGCATTALAPIGAGTQPFLPEQDERRLWNRGRELEDRLDRSGHRYVDQALERYLNEVAERLLPSDVRAQSLSWRVKILQNPLLNAFALPHGTIYVHTGLLARLEDEAQLATILGHEMAHVVSRHAVRHIRQVQNQTAFMATLLTMTAVLGPYRDLAALLGSLGTLAAVTGYSKDLELEADLEGMRWLVEAGYDPNSAPQVFRLLQEDPDGEGVKEPFFFGTHPRLQERVEHYAERLKTQYRAEAKRGRTTNREAFLSQTRAVVLDNSVLDIRLGRFNTAKAAIDKVLAQDAHHPRAHYSLGELYRQRGEARELDLAIAAYQQAIALAPDYADPYKGLGIVFYKQDLRDRAWAAFERYLILAPEAMDRAYVDDYLHELHRRRESP
jgi:predicted Zn-dependent protease